MFKKIAYYIGFDYVKNITVKNLLRLAVNVGGVLLAATPYGAPILAFMGVLPGPEAAAIVATATVLIEAIRSGVKHSEDEQPKSPTAPSYYGK